MDAKDRNSFKNNLGHYVSRTYTNKVSNLEFVLVPASPPININVLTISSTKVLIKWNPVPEKLRRGILKGYVVNYVRMQPGFIAERQVLSTSENSLELKGLSKFTAYGVTMAAFTSKGEGISWNGTFVTNEDSKEVFSVYIYQVLLFMRLN